MSLTLYHGTRAAPFERFLFCCLETDQPLNGLGHFCITDRTIATRFGQNVVAVTVEPTPSNTTVFTLRELMQWHNKGFKACVTHRRALRMDGKQLIHVTEDSVRPEQWIITDPRVVQSYVW